MSSVSIRNVSKKREKYCISNVSINSISSKYIVSVNVIITLEM